MNDENVQKDYSRCCDYCLSELQPRLFHCDDRGGTYRGCHEWFFSDNLLGEHRHPLTGGCKWPGNIEDFYRKDNVWYKKEKKSEEEEETTPDRSANSKRTPAVVKRSTSKGSGGLISRADRHPGLSWE